MSTTGVDIFTGVRPTANITIANYIGAIRPMVELQNAGNHPVLFVADLHALTDNELSVAQQYRTEVVADFCALGIDPQKTTIFAQSSIEPQVLHLTMLLARLISASELLRVPTLKDKLKDINHPESANALLLLYPVMMAADILLQRAHRVPVGEDQVAHLEVTRKLARRFNDRYGEVFPEPQPLVQKSVRILSLVGEGKMSKSNPAGAILLSDNADSIARKIKRAETAFAGKGSDKLDSLMAIIAAVATDNEQGQAASLVQRHLKGEAVMAELKIVATTAIQRFVADFQQRKSVLLHDSSSVETVLTAGTKVALAQADATLILVDKAMVSS